ncbi:ABC transporter substrate-binding protein [Pseudonocardia phyllosphaerae]|uniref:ABC transporter substrate-binding protein n=1 Tax=Pseudonocardia phyllosphaerae TaxID=3390502 RepID=UPI00397B7583
MTTTRLRRRSVAVATALLSATLALTGCSSTSDAPAPPTGRTHAVEADNGTVTVPDDPKRIVTLGNAGVVYTELGGEPVGTTEYKFDPITQAQHDLLGRAEDLGPSGGEADLEKVAGLKPDVILVWMPKDDWNRIGDELQSIAPTVFVGFDRDRFSVMQVLADAANRTDQLKAQKSDYEKRITHIKETYSKTIKETSFVGATRGSWNAPGIYKFGLVSDLCTTIARDEIGLDIPKPTTDYKRSFEQIGELAGYDAILYPVDFNGAVLDSFVPVTQTNAWRALPAVRSGHTLGVTCTSHGSYASLSHFLDQLDRALATLSTGR